MPAPSMDPHTLRVIAVAAEVDPRTVAKHLRGEQVRPMARTRIVRALQHLGLSPVVSAGATQ